MRSLNNIYFFSKHNFQIIKTLDSLSKYRFWYRIFDDDDVVCEDTIIRCSEEWFYTKKEAISAAIEQILLFEKGIY